MSDDTIYICVNSKYVLQTHYDFLTNENPAYAKPGLYAWS